MRSAADDPRTPNGIDPDDRQPDVPEMRFPGSDDDLPERLGERVEDGPGDGIATGETDLLPDVEIPEHTM